MLSINVEQNNSFFSSGLYAVNLLLRLVKHRRISSQNVEKKVRNEKYKKYFRYTKALLIVLVFFFSFNNLKIKITC